MKVNYLDSVIENGNVTLCKDQAKASSGFTKLAALRI